MRTITLAIPTYNRFELLLQSFSQVADDERVSEIVIVDDCSTDGSWEKIRDYTFKKFNEGNKKFKIFSNTINLDCYQNKKRAVDLATNDWVIILDSDNIIDKDYLDKIFAIERWDENTSYMPSFAQPTFNYEEFAGVTVSKENVASYMNKRLFDTMLNCFNFFINKHQYQRVWKGTVDPVTADSIFFNYHWFNEGNKMYVVPGLKYFHRIHEGSHYRENNHRTGSVYSDTVNKILNLR